MGMSHEEIVRKLEQLGPPKEWIIRNIMDISTNQVNLFEEND